MTDFATRIKMAAKTKEKELEKLESKVKELEESELDLLCKLTARSAIIDALHKDIEINEAKLKESEVTGRPARDGSKDLQIAMALLDKAGEFLDNWCRLRNGDAPHLMNSAHDDSSGWIHNHQLFKCLVNEKCLKCGGEKHLNVMCQKCGHDPKYFNMNRNLSYGEVD